MVNQTLKEVDIKKVKMAKKLLALFEVMGIKEEQLNSLACLDATNLKLISRVNVLETFNEHEVADAISQVNKLTEKIKQMEEEISELKDFKATVINTEKQKTEQASKEPTNLQRMLKEAFDGKVEELNVDGKRR